MLPRDSLGKLEFREEIARLLDLGDRALQRWEVVYSDFLPPPVLAEAQGLFQKFTEVQICAWGGYEQAERQRLGIARLEQCLSLGDFPLLPIEISGNFLFDPANHRDFLGAILATGIDRGKVGDIIVLGERGAQAIVDPTLGDYLALNLQQVRTVPVKVRGIEWSELKVRPPQTKEVVSVEASLRLDAVASAGFGMSRSKMVELIQQAEVRVNWQTIEQPSYQLKPGDLISIRGKGRLTIDDVMVTKKNRYRVQMTRSV
ncbi:MAG: photosystem II S4 domain protein [Pseudanabaenaceae cyanobacterium]